jgi:hypothetical protein
MQLLINGDMLSRYLMAICGNQEADSGKTYGLADKPETANVCG